MQIKFINIIVILALGFILQSSISCTHYTDTFHQLSLVKKNYVPPCMRVSTSPQMPPGFGTPGYYAVDNDYNPSASDCNKYTWSAPLRGLMLVRFPIMEPSINRDSSQSRCLVCILPRFCLNPCPFSISAGDMLVKGYFPGNGFSRCNLLPRLCKC